jgi:hypothetical protein
VATMTLMTRCLVEAVSTCTSGVLARTALLPTLRRLKQDPKAQEPLAKRSMVALAATLSSQTMGSRTLSIVGAAATQLLMIPSMKSPPTARFMTLLTSASLE